MIHIDGSQGEGGGQVLRTALALSLVTGQPFTLDNIRVKRRKPGLQRQHLACVAAAAEVGGRALADVEGAGLDSARIVFRPGVPRAGAYRFAIGTAGSTTLLFQAVLPALLACGGESTVELEGGTHNDDLAPPFEFLDLTFLAALRRMGADVDAALARHGFYPAGGGRFAARVRGRAAGNGNPVLAPLEWLERGALGEGSARVIGARLPAHVFAREAETIRDGLGWPEERVRVEMVDSAGPGNMVLIDQPAEQAREIFSAVGRRGRPAETVARAAIGAMRAWAKADVPVGPNLADQLLIPLALAGGGRFRTVAPTQHVRTNMEVVGRFLPVAFALREEGRNRWLMEVES